MPLPELLRRVGVSEQTFYPWKKRYVAREADQVRELEYLQEENTRLRSLPEGRGTGVKEGAA